MKSKFWLFFASLFVLAASSCSNDDDDPFVYTAPGVYSGTYTVDQLPALGQRSYSLFIEEDGTAVTESRGDGMWVYAAGTWSLTGDTLRTTTTSINFPTGPQITQTQKFVFSTSTGELTEGTWKDGANGSNYTGKFQNMTRGN